jgi:putative ABC transport system permease protein
VYEAIYHHGTAGVARRGLINNGLDKLRNLYPPIVLSLRNTFRNKARLAFTLSTLTLAGAVFVGVFSSHASLLEVINEFERYMVYDASISLPGGSNRFTVEREALRVQGVTAAEAWLKANATLIHPDGSEGNYVEVVGLPEGLQTIEPRILDGRWLNPSDGHQIVVNEDLASEEPDLEISDFITLRISGIERSFEVVGMVSKHAASARAYINYHPLGKLTGRHNQVDVVRVLATHQGRTPIRQEEVASNLEVRFNDSGLSSATSQTQHAAFGSITDAFDLLLVIMLIVAGMLAIVGAFGLTGTMGMNVLERTREVGVLRAVGASNKSIWQVVVVEGVLIALVSWGLTALVSLPVSRIFAEAIVHVTFNTRFVFQYSFLGLILWLAIVLLIGVFSSLAPARDAVRLTVREVLDYE